jgi:hypothetical protein
MNCVHSGEFGSVTASYLADSASRLRCFSATMNLTRSSSGASDSVVQPAGASLRWKIGTQPSSGFCCL